MLCHDICVKFKTSNIGVTNNVFSARGTVIDKNSQWSPIALHFCR